MTKRNQDISAADPEKKYEYNLEFYPEIKRYLKTDHEIKAFDLIRKDKKTNPRLIK